MRGCFSLFPKHRYAARVEAILRKERDAAKAGRHLAHWDESAYAIRAYTRGEMTADAADAVSRSTDSAKRAWMAGHGYGRR